MISLRSKKGFSFAWLIVGGAIIGFGGIYGFKVAKPYMDAATMRGIVQRQLATAKQESDITVNDIHRRVFDNANVQQLGIEYDSIHVEKEAAGQFLVNIEMTKKIPLWQNANLVLDLVIDEHTQ